MDSIMDNVPLFNANNIKKYWKNEKPHSIKRNMSVGDNKVKFTDSNFPPKDRSILSQDENGNWIDPKIGEKRGKDINVSELEWKRPEEIFNSSEFYLLEDEIEIDDIKQGFLGNCYFLSAISALAEIPGAISQIFRTNTISPIGYYEIIFFIDGEWQIVIVDDYFPVKKGTNEFKFARPNNNEIWVILLEKAWAKVNGGYLNTVGGIASDALEAMTGFGSQRFDHCDIVNGDYLWNIIIKSDEIHNVMCTSSKSDGSGEKYGLIRGHAYSLVGAKEGSYKGKKLRLVRIRNPWGNFEWNGDWSDKSNLWTDDLKKHFNYVDEDNGEFFISFEDFLQFFEFTNVCIMQYNSLSKTFSIDKVINMPQVFNLYIESESQICLSVFFKHWRYNREYKDVNHPCSIMLGTYSNEGKLTNISFGNYSSTCDLNIIKTVMKGNYVVWVFLDKDNCENPKPNKYFVKVTGQNFKINHVGTDNDFELAHSMASFGLNKIHQKEIQDCIEGEVPFYMNSDNNFLATGIGYQFVKLFSKTQYHIWNQDTSQCENMNILKPFRGKNNFDFKIKNEGELIILGLRGKEFKSYWFNVESKYQEFNLEEDNNNNKIEFESNNTRNLSKFLKIIPDLENFDCEFDYKTLDFEINQSINFKKLKSQEKSKKYSYEQLKDEFPYEFEIMETFEDSRNNSELTIEKFRYDNGLYIGQYDENKKRSGVGTYIMNNNECFYIGHWKDGVQEKTGIIFDNNKKPIYKGEFKNGLKHGDGELNYVNGDKFIGKFFKDKREGSGSYIWSDGSKWEGTFRNGQLHGKGVFYPINDEEPWDVEYQNGEYKK